MTRLPLAFAACVAAACIMGACGAEALPRATADQVLALLPVQYGYGNQVRKHHGPNGGYHVNRMGYGNYTRGPNGGFGGYPAGSAGAEILQEQQRRKCSAVPESC